MNELEAVILGYVRREYVEEGDTRELFATTPLISSGIVDSFSMVSLKRFLEKTYDVKIPDELATPEAFDTVKSVATLVESLKAERKVEVKVRQPA